MGFPSGKWYLISGLPWVFSSSSTMNKTVWTSKDCLFYQGLPGRPSSYRVKPMTPIEGPSTSGTHRELSWIPLSWTHFGPAGSHSQLLLVSSSVWVHRSLRTTASIQPPLFLTQGDKGWDPLPYIAFCLPWVAYWVVSQHPRDEAETQTNRKVYI